MNKSIADLKAVIVFSELVAETHTINRDGKVHCPVHNDQHPSCHIYQDEFHCFSCGAHGDALEWLERLYSLTKAEAKKELARRVDGQVSVRRPHIKEPLTPSSFKPLEKDVFARHLQLADSLNRIPLAMQGRGFNLQELRQFKFAAIRDDAVFPIFGPDGVPLALKRRFAKPQNGRRYCYTTSKHGAPAWCSPNFLEADEVLVIEGELNAIACYLAAPHLAVMGVAGAEGKLYLGSLRERMVYCYADGDQAGLEACKRWASDALAAGARAVYEVAPWPSDACDLVGQLGRAALRGRLI